MSEGSPPFTDPAQSLGPGERLIHVWPFVTFGRREPRQRPLDRWFIVRPDEDWSHLNAPEYLEFFRHELHGVGEIPETALGEPWHTKAPCHLGCGHE